MRWPERSAKPAIIRLALAPTSEPLPPRQAPKASDHHSGTRFSAPPKVGAMDLITGIMVATNGMLSTTAEAVDENCPGHITASRVELTDSLLQSIRQWMANRRL